MYIIIKRNNIIVDGLKKDAKEIFKINKFHNCKKPVVFDLRCNAEFKEKDIEIINRSGRNYFIIGVNDWFCVLETKQKIFVKQGFMEYRGQKSI